MPFQKGNIPWNKNKKLSEEIRKKWSEAHKGLKHSEETKKKISEAHKGKHFSAEHRENISRARRQRPIVGKKKTAHGYIMILKKSHPHADHQGYVYEHRLIMEKIRGRYLKPEEIVHHKNGIPDDNRPENLRLFESNFEHLMFHQKHGGKQ